MKNKGFTLAELIGVIVVLGVIAVIAIPVVGKIIEDSKIETAKAGANSIIRSAQEYYANVMADKGKFTPVTLDIVDSIKDGTLEMEGTLPQGGTVSIDHDSTIQVYMIVDNYCIKANSNSDKVTAEEVEPNEEGIIVCE